MSALSPRTEVVVQWPSVRLQPYLTQYVGYRYSGFPAGLHRGLPSRNLTFIISLDGPVEMQLAPGHDQSISGVPFAMQAFVGGLQTWPAHIVHDGSQHGIAVELTPLGASAVLGVPGGELAGCVFALDDLLGARGRRLTEQLLNTDGWPARFRLLDGSLAAGLSEHRAPAAGVEQAWSWLVNRPGDLDVAALAQEIGWSRRHLSEQVRREIGLPPRQLARVLRFERSRGLLRESALRESALRESALRESACGKPIAGRTMTDVAMAAGYFDSAHLIHEWQRLAGCTPTAWLHEELPPVQDTLPAERAS
jgi:AraC-like DNA-binding protein